MSLDQKEELKQRMKDLERKLADSEKERFKLEKMCSVLMRAFKEEEKNRYNNLNKKYEKFLQDCNLRKKRNDIILRSLCRIEDRWTVLSSKTERLKYLKDRYLSYLRIQEFKACKLPLKSFPHSPTSEKTAYNVSSKSVQWKSPEVEEPVQTSPSLSERRIETIKKSIPKDEEYYDEENITQDFIVEEKNPENSLQINHLSASDSDSEDKQDSHVEAVTTVESKVPMGLDGVDYQNETYPESYYEQPVHHHNHTSIAADVILEEDETELEQEDQPNYPKPDIQPKLLIDSGSELEQEQPILETPTDKTKPKSSLLQMLESDTESFQIEHGGDGASGNDDSDFDFSFH